jgi:hypothetical protein
MVKDKVLLPYITLQAHSVALLTETTSPGLTRKIVSMLAIVSVLL